MELIPDCSGPKGEEGALKRLGRTCHNCAGEEKTKQGPFRDGHHMTRQRAARPEVEGLGAAVDGGRQPADVGGLLQPAVQRVLPGHPPAQREARVAPAGQFEGAPPSRVQRTPPVQVGGDSPT